MGAADELVLVSPDMLCAQSSERRFKVSRKPPARTVLTLTALFDEHACRLMSHAARGRFLFDRPARSFVRARHALQGETPWFGVEQQLMSAQSADQLAQPRRKMRPVGGGAFTHEIPPRWNCASIRRARNASEMPTERQAYLSRRHVGNVLHTCCTIELNKRDTYEASCCCHCR